MVTFNSNIRASLFLFTLLVSCTDREAEWKEDKSSMMGTKYTDLVLCAGPPEAEMTVSPTVGMVSYSSHDTFFWEGTTTPLDCKVNITITNGVISNVNEQENNLYMCEISFKHCPWYKERS